MVAAAVLLFAWVRVAAAVRVDCAEVISHINREIRLGGGRYPDMSRLAKELGTSTIWVEHCMRAYGRRLRRPGWESAESREKALELLEEEEPEESGPEDVEEPGAREREERPEKFRYMKVRPTPTPRFLND